jgi:hypothetical protein
MNNQILKHQGKIIQQQSKMKKSWEWLKINWKLCLPLLISLLAFGVSIWANYIACNANDIASKSHDLTLKISKLDLRPIIELNTLFKSIGKIPPHLSLTNIGPIEAQQVKIRMISHRYIPKQNKILISMSDSSNDIFEEKINPQETKSHKFPEGWLNTNARIQSPPQHNVMEIQITYRRPQDLEKYDESAYYFVNPDGIWVPEKSNSLNSELYDSIKAAIFNIDKEKMYIYKEFGRDKLHSNK